jgi:hypothetical protein
MRGDSLRDLYAKTIALCGLALLGGAGALVDYWPTGVEFASVDPAFVRPEAVRPLPVPDRDMMPVLASAARRHVSVPASARPAHQPAVLPLELASVDGDTIALGSSVELPAPAVAFADGMANPAAAATGPQQVAFVLHNDEPFEALTSLPIAPAPGAADDGDGFITGAFKRTGTSLARTGAKTAVLVKTGFVSGLATVTGAVRRVIPDFN